MADVAPDNPNQSPEAWSAAAHGYGQFLGAWTAYAEEALRLAPLRPTDVVLDVAAGTGILARAAARRAARVVAVDFSPGMIAELSTLAAADGLRNVETGVMDAQALGLGDASFDAAYCLFGFMFFPDRARAFRELHRVVKPGARVVVATWAPIERRPVMRLAFDALAEAAPQFPLPAKGDLQTVQECEAEMSAAGFRDVKAHPFTSEMRFESAERYFDAVMRTAAPIHAIRKRMGEPAWAALEARVLAAVKKRMPADGATLSAEALITVGTR
jgi:ubiquinone/menaquinone biosynthesis C-methylase UbiE